MCFFKTGSDSEKRLRDIGHELRSSRYCWCDAFTLAAQEMGLVQRFYIIEIKFHSWKHDEMWSVFQLNTFCFIIRNRFISTYILFLVLFVRYIYSIELLMNCFIKADRCCIMKFFYHPNKYVFASLKYFFQELAQRRVRSPDFGSTVCQRNRKMLHEAKRTDQQTRRLRHRQA